MKVFKQTLEELSKLIVGALTFVAALAWNEAFKSYFSNNKYLKGKGLWFYAISISIVAILIIISINILTKQINKMYAFIIFLITIIGIVYLYNILSNINTLNDTENNK